MREKVDMKSQAQGFAESRLPHFTESQSLMVANTSGTLMVLAMLCNDVECRTLSFTICRLPWHKLLHLRDGLSSG